MPSPAESWLARPPRCSVVPALLPWLTDPASLTRRICARSRQFAVTVLVQGLARVHRDEAALLGLRRGELAWLREVVLEADGVPVVIGTGGRQLERTACNQVALQPGCG